MATHDDTLMRPKPKSTLLAEPASKAAAKPPEPQIVVNNAAAGGDAGSWDDFDPLPQAGDPYKAYARPGNKPEITLHVMLKDGFYRGFAWNNYDSVDVAPSDKPGGGTVLVVRFAGLVPTELRISCGRLLGTLHAAIGRQRIAWIRELPSKRGFGGIAAVPDHAEAITSIAVNRWKPERPAAGGG